MIAPDDSRIRRMFTLCVLAGVAGDCGCATMTASPSTPRPQGAETSSMLDETDTIAAIEALCALYPRSASRAIDVGVRQAARLWTREDGTPDEFITFCKEHYLEHPTDRMAFLARIEENMEQVFGHLLEMSRSLRRPTDLDLGPVLAVDRLFAQYDLGAHAIEDFFKNKVAFAVLLNFEQKTLSQLTEQSASLSREQWAQARAVDLFSSRVPSAVEQAVTNAFVEADDYINSYNIHMGHLLTQDSRRLFPGGLVLISHWGLRDELKSHYGEPGGTEKQRLIAAVMERIVRQQIPASFIDNPDVDWIVSSGEIHAAPGASQIAPMPGVEPNIRYEKLLTLHRAVASADPYHPSMPNYIQRKFEKNREIPKQRVIELLESVLTSDTVEEIAGLIRQRLGRPLEPFDIWYDGFSSRAGSSEQSLDEEVRRRYPTVSSFEKDIPRILRTLGFDRENALDIGSRIAVDPARGAGHALGAERRGDKAHLRTRVPSGGMNYKGYNIAMHELGHNVEQVLSLDRIDHWLLRGVPNTAFTEGFAFAFQGKDLEVLGRPPRADARALATLDTFWSTFEISGVAMVDIGIWEWLYAHPGATADDLRQAVLDVASGVWNKYYAKVFGHSDAILLAVYSHIIDAGLYTPDYPLGFLIQFQMDKYFLENGLAKEMDRMCRLGSITPDAWMIEAVGEPISARPLIDAAHQAVMDVSQVR